MASGAVTTLPVPNGPEGLAVSASGNIAVAACNTADMLAVVDVAAGIVTKTIAIGDNARGGAVTLDPAGTKAVVGVNDASYRGNRCAVPSPFVDGYYMVDLPPRRGPRLR